MLPTFLITILRLMIQAPENFVLVEIERKFQDSQGGLLIDTTWFPEEHATLEGIVRSAPVRIVSDGYRQIIGTVKEGDKVFFSYGTIFSYHLQPDNDTPVYKNLIIYDGKEYWRVNISEVFFKNDIEMITNNVLVEPLSESSGIVKGVGKIGLSCQVGDTIVFEPQFVQQYSFFNQFYFIIPASRVIAKY